MLFPIAKCGTFFFNPSWKIKTIIKFKFKFYLFPDIPILPTVSAKITFQEFAFRDDIPDSHFEVPLGYAEDPNRSVFLFLLLAWFVFYGVE